MLTDTKNEIFDYICGMKYTFSFPRFGQLDVYELGRRYCLFHFNVVPGDVISFETVGDVEIIFKSKRD